MKKIPDDLYDKINSVTDIVKKQFRLKGIVIPTKNADGSINLGNFKVVKTDEGFYAILNYRGDTIADKINLPQSAALIANDLALGKFLNKHVLEKDRQYGYSLFEEELYRHLISTKTQDLARYEITAVKMNRFQKRREIYQKDLVSSFDKLRKLA